MFNKNDKSLFIFRKIVNALTIILMAVCVIAGIVCIAMSFGKQTINDGFNGTQVVPVFYFGNFIIGIVALLLGPILLQLIWLALDVKFNAMLDVKIIRNAQYGAPVPELPELFFIKCNKKSEAIVGVESTFDTLKKYRELVDAEVISQEEFDEIKKQLLNKNVDDSNNVETTIEKIKKLKSYADENVITAEEFAEEKSKILKK